MPGRTRMPRRTEGPTPALLDEGPQLHLDQDLLGNQAVIDLTLGGSSREEPGILSFDNPNPKLDRRTRVGVGDGEAPKTKEDWHVEPKTEERRPPVTAPEAPRGVDTTAPTILPVHRPKSF